MELPGNKAMVGPLNEKHQNHSLQSDSESQSPIRWHVPITQQRVRDSGHGFVSWHSVLAR